MTARLATDHQRDLVPLRGRAPLNLAPETVVRHHHDTS